MQWKIGCAFILTCYGRADIVDRCIQMLRAISLQIFATFVDLESILVCTLRWRSDVMSCTQFWVLICVYCQSIHCPWLLLTPPSNLSRIQKLGAAPSKCHWVPLVCHLRCPSSFPSSPVPFSNHGYRENAAAWKRRHDMRINHYTGLVQLLALIVIMQLCFCCALRTAMLRKAIKINFQPLNPWESLLILNCVVL